MVRFAEIFSDIQIELLEMEGSDIHVAEYLTSLVSIELLEQKLHDSIAKAKQRLEYKV